MEKHIRSPMDTEGILGVLALSAFDHEGCRRCVAVQCTKTSLVATAKQYAMMRAKQEKAYQELKLFGNCGTKAKIDERSSRGSSVKDIPGDQGPG